MFASAGSESESADLRVLAPLGIAALVSLGFGLFARTSVHEGLITTTTHRMQKPVKVSAESARNGIMGIPRLDTVDSFWIHIISMCLLLDVFKLKSSSGLHL